MHMIVYPAIIAKKVFIYSETPFEGNIVVQLVFDPWDCHWVHYAAGLELVLLPLLVLGDASRAASRHLDVLKRERVAGFTHHSCVCEVLPGQTVIATTAAKITCVARYHVLGGEENVSASDAESV